MTLTGVLANRYRDEPDAECCTLIDREGGAVGVTFGQLMARAFSFAHAFGRPQAEPRIVGVCLYHGLDLYAAFLGALWAGHIPTMLAPPSPRMEPGKYADSFARMVQHVRPAMIATDAPTLEKLGTTVDTDFAGARVIAADSVKEAPAMDPWSGSETDVAVLQHSSGTTGLQKGVALSHGAILRHNARYAERIELGRSDVIVSWLPLYHDMGFIACFLMPLLERVHVVQISPFDWVVRPALLLEAITRFRGTLCWLPNFAFKFMADNVRTERLQAPLDLGSIRAWINSSEPVLDSSHAAFIERFADCGARREQLCASYAMAENVYAVTQSLPREYRTLAVRRRPFIEEHRTELAASSDTDTIGFVSNGRAVAGTEISILAPAGAVGEIAIRGEHLFTGYFLRDDLTTAAMTDDGFYRTGDLGFLHEGELFVTGRKKDLIIVQGRNFYPTDVENVVAEVGGVQPGRVVAFGVSNDRTGTEDLVILAEASQEAEQDARRLALTIRQRIAATLDCTPGDVRIVPSRWLVKSTAGKLARADNRAKYLKHFG